jgi:hypothetical protein
VFGRAGRDERKLRVTGRQAPAVVVEADQSRWTTTSGNPDLAALHDHGVLDDEESAAQKARLLNEPHPG